MKTIKNNDNKMTIVLEENDTLQIETMWGNPIQIIIEAHDGVILIDEVPFRKIHNVKLEEQQVKTLKEYIDK